MYCKIARGDTPGHPTSCAGNGEELSKLDGIPCPTISGILMA